MKVTFEEVKENLRKDLIEDGLDLSPSCCVTQCGSFLTVFALAIIGCVAAAGAFPGGSTLGWTTVGLAGGAYVLDLAYGNLGKRRVDLRIHTLATLALLTVGILGGIGQLSMQQLGWTIIGIQLSHIAITYYFRPKRTSPKPNIA